MREAAVIVTAYEDRAGRVYIEKDEQTWLLGPVTRDIADRFEKLATAWAAGEWQPDPSAGHQRTDRESLEPIASWSAFDGVAYERDHDLEITAGSAGRSFLGIA